MRQLVEAPGTTVSCVDGPSSAEVRTLLLTPTGAGTPQLAVRVPATAGAAISVEHEARMLVELRRRVLGPLRATLPRFVQLCEEDGRVALVASALPGRPLPGAFCGPGPRGHRTCRASELEVVATWLERFQDATWQPSAPVEVLSPAVLARLNRVVHGAPRPTRGTVEGHGPGPVVADRARRVQDLLGRHEAPRSAVHGDLRAPRVLVDGTGPAMQVSGVVGWRHAAPRGEPLVDLGRFAVTHAHRSFARAVPGAVLLVGRGPHAVQARRFVQQGLARLGLPESLWYPVAWAATAGLLADPVGGAGGTGGTGGDKAALLRLLARVPDPAAHAPRAG